MSKDVIDEIFKDVSKNDLDARIEIIRESILDLGNRFKSLIPVDLSDEQMVINKNFKTCMIATLILNLMDQDQDNEDFNRVLYYMFEESKSVINLIDQYELGIHHDENGNIGFELIVIETEFTEDEE